MICSRGGGGGGADLSIQTYQGNRNFCKDGKVAGPEGSAPRAWQGMGTLANDNSRGGKQSNKTKEDLAMRRALQTIAVEHLSVCVHA